MAIANVFPEAVKSGDGFSAFCPAHTDERPSLSVAVKNGRALVRCHAGCSNKAVAKALGFKTEALMYDAIEGGSNTSKPRKPKTIIKVARRRAPKRPESATAEILKHLAASFAYEDERGDTLYYVDRFEWQGQKTFRPRLPDGRRTLDNVRRVVFRLAQIQGQPIVYLGEGETVVMALEGLGFVATTTVGGANGWSPEYAQELYDAGVKEVIGLPDNDEPGRKYIAEAARDCAALGITFRTVVLPDLGPSEDAVDWFARGHTRDELVQLTQNAPVHEVQTIVAGDLIQDYVYSVATKRFMHIETLETLDKEQLDAVFATQFPLRAQGTFPASVEFLNDPAARKVAAPTYRPGAGRFVPEPGRLCINLYRPSILVPTPGDVGPWRRHLRYLIPDKKARRVVLKWFAFQVQHPDRKINWAIFIGGRQGIGKDALLVPLCRALGDHNVAVISPDDLANGWTDWLKDRKLVVVQEFAVFEKKTLMNRMNPLIASPPTKLRINAKFVPQYDIPNLASFVFFSNHREALQLDADDRRFFVYWSEAEAKTKEYYTQLYAWMEANAAAVYQFLLSVDLSSFGASGQAPMTAEKLRVIRESQSPVEQYLRGQHDARQAPLDRDLITINSLIEDIPRVVGHVSARSVAAVLRKLGARELPRQLRLHNGTRPRVWAVRNVEVYERMSERELSAAYQTGRAQPWPVRVLARPK